ncbi:MAG: tRNA (N6-isopentenyl adenosine(37)-C2)-methylthiotransferase MiaB [bacterium]|nr:tRNA (N6-isopentenyl adenosine(37)-C2)-methylthiotransferase MiaB [Deltaproteobacteria bacterium]MCP4908406.1 tRNA (N6-isopentenyl adenosine(37)-C2)-methylthiotransferase MiaB [bacterium]
MNVHDSEKVVTLLEDAGLSAAASESEADLLVINTCSIRDKAEHQLYSDLGKLREWKAEKPGRIVGVGGCVAQQVGDRLLSRFGHLDFVFGTHHLRRVPAMLDGALAGRRAAWVGEDESQERFDLPARRPALATGPRRRAFVTVMEGCDMFCSFCIVPSTRGREISRAATEIDTEVRQLADQGILEIMLLGQTVNAYGRHDVRRGRAAAAGTMPFAELLGQLDAIPGIERIRYTSPHPLFYDAALIRAHGELEHLCPNVHLPVQSGSNRILEQMRRRYTRERYFEILGALRAARPDVAITSDLIVGFPGETEGDFEQTLDLVRVAGLVDSFSFKYSPRPGTGAAGMGAEVPAEVAQDRLERLQAQQRDQTLAYHQSRVGQEALVLIEGPSRRGGHQVTGRDLHHRVVNLDLCSSLEPPGAAEPGTLLPARVVGATPHSLLAAPLDPALLPGAEDPDFPRSRLKSSKRRADETESVDCAGGLAEDVLRVL